MSFKQTANYQKGKQGEKEVIEKLISEGKLVNDYTDYDEHKHKQKKGYDIEVFNSETNEWDRVDIKTNVRGDFLYIELASESGKSLGWFYTAASDFIFHYDIENKSCYYYSLKDMRNYLNKNLDKYKIVGKNQNLVAIKLDNKLIKKLF